jgi:hypothetical protein
MDDDQIYRRVREALDNIPDNFSVLEEQIDVRLQMEYFEFAKKIRESEDIGLLIENSDILFRRGIKNVEKKKVLSALASSGEVESFRKIERYLQKPDPGLKDWAVLALQEGRMLLHTALLDEQQVFISTGLGGKGRKLRYFVVFMNSLGNSLTPIQSKLLHGELKYTMEKNDGELEEYREMIDYTTALVILPLKAPLREIFRGIIEECNQYGNFLKEDMVITNVKRLNPPEIVEILNQQRNREDGPEFGFDPEDENGMP